MGDELYLLAERVGVVLRDHGLMLTAAESCTGGLIAKCVTDVPGSSAWFERGFVTYTNDAKREMLGVKPQTLKGHGAVSEETVREMAIGALAHSSAQVSVAVSGIAGPTGGSAEKPVGMVCFAWADTEHGLRACTERFAGDRAAVREQAARRALAGVLEHLAHGA